MNLPELFLARMKEKLGESFPDFLSAYQNPPVRGLRVNNLKIPREEFLRRFPYSLAPVPWEENGFYVQEEKLGAHPYHFAGLYYLQEPSAMCAAPLLGAAEGERVLDLCAAPGGKAFAAAMEMGDEGEITACDIHRHKLALIEKGARRLGLRCIRAELADGRQTREEWREAFDLVLCDVPCSGLGIIRKKPDIRYKDPAALAGLPAVQGAILDNASRYVRPGGVLLYATCTVLPEENEGVTAAFLEKRRAFRKEPFTLPGPAGETEGSLTLWPQRHGTDGFYICKMRKL